MAVKWLVADTPECDRTLPQKITPPTGVKVIHECKVILKLGLGKARSKICDMEGSAKVEMFLLKQKPSVTS